MIDRAIKLSHGLTAAAGARQIQAHLSDPGRLRCLPWREDGRTRRWRANLSEESLQAGFEGVPAGAARLWMLDQDSYEAAIKDPAFGDHSEPFTGDRLTFRRFAIAQLSFGG